MAKRRTTRRKTRRYGPSTRKGQIRKTARRAYSRRRPNPRPYRATRRRRNPRPLLAQPAVRYGASAVAGAAAAAALNQWADRQLAAGQTGLAAVVKPKFGTEGAHLHAGVVGAALTIGLSMLPRVKARTRNNLLAAGVGMLTQPVVGLSQNLLSAAEQPAAVNVKSPIRALPRPVAASSGYRSSAHYNAAAFVGVPVS
jgi:hypothetical protein